MDLTSPSDGEFALGAIGIMLTILFVISIIQLFIGLEKVSSPVSGNGKYELQKVEQYGGPLVVHVYCMYRLFSEYCNYYLHHHINNTYRVFLNVRPDHNALLSLDEALYLSSFDIER